MRATLLLVSLLAACNQILGIEVHPVTRDGGGGDPDSGGPCTDCPERVAEIPVTAERSVDLLFVIDNSFTMDVEHDALRNAFPTLIDLLTTLEGGLPDLHIGVVTSNVGAGSAPVSNCIGEGDDGILRNVAYPDTPCPIGDRWISDVANKDGSRETNYTGSLVDAFDCISSVGNMGCGFEQHLEAMRRAFVQPANAGFLRDEAILAVVIVADEDDCSASDETVFNLSDMTLGPTSSFRCTEWGVICDGQPIARDPAPATYTSCEPRDASPYIANPDLFADVVRDLKPDPRKRVVSAMIAPVDPFTVGPDSGMPTQPALNPSCGTMEGPVNGWPGVRLQSFADQFAPLSHVSSVCEPDFTPAIEGLFSLLQRAIGTPCLAGPIDLTDQSSSEPGLQVACIVHDVIGFGTGSEQATQLAPCEMIDGSTPDLAASDLPCWWVAADALCGTETNLQIHVERDASPDPTTVVTVDCVLED